MADSLNDALHAWRSHEAQYEKVRAAVDAFASDAALIGVQMIQDVPTRVEYMRMIRAEADDMLAYARANRETVRLVFDRIYERRSELRLIQQSRAKAAVAVLSKLITKNPSKYQLLVRAADSLAREGKLPSVVVGKEVRSRVPLGKLSPDQLDDVFLKAIDKAGGSRKTITPSSMKMRGAGLLLLTVALAGLDIYLAQDKSFAVSKNVTSIGGGFGGAWAGAAVGLAVGGPVGGLVGLIVGGVAGSYAAEEVHYAVRGLHARPDVDQLVKRHYAAFDFDEDGLGRALHTEFLGDLEAVWIAFSHLNEQRNAEADDVAFAYIEVAQRLSREFPKGALIESLRTPLGQALLQLLFQIQDDGWTTPEEHAQMAWLRGMMLRKTH